MTIQFDNLSTNEHAALNEVVSRLSHDLRSPARNIGHLAEWIEEDLKEEGIALPEKVREEFALLRDRCTGLSALVQRLIDYDAVACSADPFDGDWQALLDAVVSELPDAAKVDLTIACDAVPDIAVCDARTIFYELIGNALRCCPDPVIAVGVRADKDDVAIEITDNGPGFPEGTLIRPFRRSSDAAGHVSEGAGLCRIARIARHYGGWMNVTNRPDGAGAAVTVGLLQKL